MNTFEKDIIEIVSLNLSELGLWYLGVAGLVLLLILVLYLIGFLGIIYYTVKYRNINQVNEVIDNKISFKILNGVADILAIYLVGLCLPLLLWWVAYLIKTYII